MHKSDPLTLKSTVANKCSKDISDTSEIGKMIRELCLERDSNGGMSDFTKEDIECLIEALATD